MADLATVRFVDLRDAGQRNDGIDLRLPADQIPKRGGSFLLIRDTSVRVVGAHLFPNAESGAHWVIFYRQTKADT